MQIDITREPPPDIFRERPRYLKIAATLLALVGCGGLVMAYGVVSDTPPSETLETVALVLFVAPGLLFVYFAAKLQDYKRLNPDQKRELAALARKHPEIATYCGLVAKAGREIIHAEYEACQDRDEDPRRNP